MKQAHIRKVLIPALVLGLALTAAPQITSNVYADDAVQGTDISAERQDSAEAETEDTAVARTQEVSPAVSRAAAEYVSQNGPASGKTVPVKAARSPQRAAATVATRLSISGPGSGDKYEGDTITITARLTDTSGNGIGGKSVRINFYNGGNWNGLSSRTVSTDSSGNATFSFNDLAAGNYNVYASFGGDASEWGGNTYSSSEDTNTVSFAVKPASEGPSAGSGSGDPSSSQIPTKVSITNIEKEGTTFTIKAYAEDNTGKPVGEDVSGYNIELYVDGVNTSSAKLDTWDYDGTVSLPYVRLSNGEHDVYVKYIGRGKYASSESQHYTVNVQDDSYTAEPVAPPEPPREDPQTGGGENPGSDENPGADQPSGDDKEETAVPPAAGTDNEGSAQDVTENPAVTGRLGTSAAQISGQPSPQNTDKAEISSAPKTADNSNVLLWTVLLLACAGILTGACFYKNQKHNEG